MRLPLNSSLDNLVHGRVWSNAPNYISIQISSYYMLDHQKVPWTCLQVWSHHFLMHSALKLEKKCHFKSTKTHFLPFQKWQKINFCTRKKSENGIFASFKLFPCAEIDFCLHFWNSKKWVFVLLQLQFFSNFRALCIV